MHQINPAGSDPVLPAKTGKADNTPIQDRDAALFKSAQDLEAAFLAEMLKSAGFGKARDSNGGGAGEDQFGSLLVRAQAENITRAGGIGLAESLFNALKEAENGTPNRAESD